LVEVRGGRAVPNEPAGRFGSEVLFLIPVAGLAVAMLSFGRYIAAAGFIVASGFALGGTSWPRLLARALVVVLVIYLVFDLLVPQNWPKPWLFGL
ncbi:MAG: hypothetical protein AB7U48_14945, partial [Bauldia sp.]